MILVKCGVLCLLFLVVKSVKRPLSVTRGVQDRFRADEFSCAADKHVCTRRNALCHSDGSCLCRNNTPDYVNPKFSVQFGYLTHGVSDGCMLMEPVVDSIDPYNLACSYSFRPYQLVPSSYQEEPIKFIHPAGTHYSSCNFSHALVKYPSQKTWVPFASISEDHIDINMTTVGVLLFRWRVPVPQLQGLMVVISLNCSRFHLNHIYSNNTLTEQCLRIKVMGTAYSSGMRISRNVFDFIVLVFIGILISYINT